MGSSGWLTISFMDQQAELKKSIEAFESYIIDSDNKRLRALKKAAEQKKIREAKEVQLEKLNETFQQVKVARTSMLKQLRRAAVLGASWPR